MARHLSCFPSLAQSQSLFLILSGFGPPPEEGAARRPTKSQVFKEVMSSLGQGKGRGFLEERGRQGQSEGRARLAGLSLNQWRHRGSEEARLIPWLVTGAGHVAYGRSSNNFISSKVSCHNISEMAWNLTLVYIHQQMIKLA